MTDWFLKECVACDCEAALCCNTLPYCRINLENFWYEIVVAQNKYFIWFLLSSIHIKRKYWVLGNFRHPFFDGFACLRFPEHDLTIFWKCMSVCRSACMSPKFCGHCISKTNARKLTKLYIQLHVDILWCWLDFVAYRLKSSDAVWNLWFL